MKRYIVPALGIAIGALGIYLTRTLPKGFLFPVLCLSGSVAGLFVVLPYMAFRRIKQARSGKGNYDYVPPTDLSEEEEKLFRARHAARAIVTVFLLLALLCVVAWRVLKLRS